MQEPTFRETGVPKDAAGRGSAHGAGRGAVDVRRRDVLLSALKAAPVIVLLTARGARANESGGSGGSGT